MILPDTSIWVDHFRYNNEFLGELLANRHILCHPYIVAELSLGSIREREKTLALLDGLPQVRFAYNEEVRALIKRRSLHSRGIGLIDAHLLASVSIDPPALLWTADKRLRLTAMELGVHADFPTRSIN